MTCPMKPWGNGVILPVAGGTYNVTTQRAFVITNVSASSPVSWTINLLSSTIARDGASFFWSDWDPVGAVTLVADVPMSIPGRGYLSTQPLLSGIVLGLVYVKAQNAWIPVSYYHP